MRRRGGYSRLSWCQIPGYAPTVSGKIPGYGFPDPWQQVEHGQVEEDGRRTAAAERFTAVLEEAATRARLADLDDDDYHLPLRQDDDYFIPYAENDYLHDSDEL